MKWYNKEKTKMLNLESVDGFVFIPAKEFIEQNPDEEEDVLQNFKDNGDKLELIIGGAVYIFRGDVANELYDLLTLPTESCLNGQQLLQG